MVSPSVDFLSRGRPLQSVVPLQHLQPKAKKGEATSQAEFELRCALWTSTKRIMEVESMVSNLAAENRLLRSQISRMILLICPGVSDSSTTSEDSNIMNLNMKESECHYSFLQHQMT